MHLSATQRLGAPIGKVNGHFEDVDSARRSANPNNTQHQRSGGMRGGAVAGVRACRGCWRRKKVKPSLVSLRKDDEKTSLCSFPRERARTRKSCSRRHTAHIDNVVGAPAKFEASPLCLPSSGSDAQAAGAPSATKKARFDESPDRKLSVDLKPPQQNGAPQDKTGTKQGERVAVFAPSPRVSSTPTLSRHFRAIYCGATAATGGRWCPQVATHGKPKRPRNVETEQSNRPGGK